MDRRTSPSKKHCKHEWKKNPVSSSRRAASFTRRHEQHFPGLVLAATLTIFTSMETAIVTVEGGRQTVRLPKSVHLPTNVFVRQDGESVVLEPAKPKTWPEGFFDSIHVTDPAFERPEQGQLPPVKNL